MKNLLIIAAFLTILSIKSYSQIIFENGYLINDSNQRINCLIKNIDWKNNPSKFDYKTSPDDSIQSADILKVKEFGITGISKYIRAKVNIDRSSDEIDKLSTESKPTFLEEVLFLKVLIEGKASLYQYENGNLIRFFYNLNDSMIEQLVYKRYLIDQKISQNNFFRQQLFIDLYCQAITSNDVKDIKYVKKEIKRVFIKYNECINSSSIDFEQTQKKDLFNLSFRPGLNYSSLTIDNSASDSRNIDFGNKISFRFGIETEFILPFNKNKWAIILEPTFQYFESKKTTEANNISGGILVSKVDYKSIEIPIGIRHYFFINDKSKIFVNICYLFDYSNNSIVEFTRSDGSILNSLDVKSRRNASLGIGFKLKDKYSIEMQYHTSRQILGDYVYWYTDYKTLSIIFGYSLF